MTQRKRGNGTSEPAVAGGLRELIAPSLAAVALIIAVLTFGRHDALLYAYWAAAVLSVSVAAVLICLNLRFRRSVAVAFVAMSVWLVYPILITSWATEPSVHIKIIALAALYNLFTVVAVGAISTSATSTLRFLGTLAIVWVLLNGSLLLLHVANVVTYDGRHFSGAYYNRNTAAVVGVMLFGSCLMMRRAFARQFGSITVLLLQLSCVLIVFATGSTKGLIGLVLFALGWSWYAGRRGLNRLALLLLIAASVVVVLQRDDLESVARAREKAAALVQSGEPNLQVGASGYQRVWLTLQSAKLIAERPWTGVGVHNSQFHLFTERYFVLVARGEIEDTGVGVYSHNNYTEMLLNGGIVAFLAYYLPLLWLLRRLGSLRVSGDRECLRRFLFIALLVKLVLDVGMVSYLDLAHGLIIGVAWMFVLRPGAVQLLRPGDPYLAQPIATNRT